MGCSSSTATGALQPTRVCTRYEDLVRLCSGDRGGFGCFVLKDMLKVYKDFIIKKYDLYIADQLLSDEGKVHFIEKVISDQSIEGLKIFFARISTSGKTKSNSFENEVHLYNYLLNNYPPNLLIVKKLSFLSIINSSTISFSIKANRYSSRGIPKQFRQIDFIFLEACTVDLSRIKPKDINLNQIIRSMVTYIHSLHKDNIYHMDIKPENILLCNKKYKLIDYGLAIKVPSYDTITVDYLQTQLKKVFGTYEYVNPMFLVLINQAKYSHNKLYDLNILAKDCGISFLQLQVFMNNYEQFITPNGIFFKIDSYLQYIQSAQKEDLYPFLNNLYARADWYAFAKVIFETAGLLSFENGKAIGDDIMNGIIYLFSLTDKDLNNPTLDIEILNKFKIRRTTVNNFYKH